MLSKKKYAVESVNTCESIKKKSMKAWKSMKKYEKVWFLKYCVFFNTAGTFTKMDTPIKSEFNFINKFNQTHEKSLHF